MLLRPSRRRRIEQARDQVQQLVSRKRLAGRRAGTKFARGVRSRRRSSGNAETLFDGRNPLKRVVDLFAIAGNVLDYFGKIV